MKRLSFLLVTMLLCHLLNAQIDFNHFINEIDWNSTEDSLIKKYSESIEPRNHYYNDKDKTVTDYKVTGIKLGEFECSASLEVDSVSKKLVELSFNFNGIEKKMDAVTLSNQLDKELIALFGTPDKEKNDMDNKYVKDRDRTWYKDKYIINVIHMIFSDSHLYSLSVKGVKDNGNDFRVAKWGESKASIMKKEGKEDAADMDKIYLFSDVVAGYNCDVAYIFTNDKLTMAKYLFHPSHTNKNEYIYDYKKLVNLMTEKYGEPNYNSPEWKNSLYKDEPDSYGFAVSLGHLSYSAGWFGETTEITTALYGENYEISLIIQYVSKKYEGLKEKQDTQEKIKDL